MDETNEAQPGLEASAKEKHDFLVGVLKETRAGVVDFMFKQAAILTLVLGWVISSQTAQAFFAAQPEARYAAAAGVIFLCPFLTRWVLNYRRRSLRACEFLVELRYMPREFYSDIVVTKRFAISLIILYLIACLVLLTCLFYIVAPSANPRACSQLSSLGRWAASQPPPTFFAFGPCHRS